MVSTTAKTLKLDYDGPIPQELRALLRFTEETLRVKVVGLARKRSAGGQGWHVRVELNRALPVQVVVALQAILGSDPRREVFNLSRALVLGEAQPFWQSRWNVLYLSKLGDTAMLDVTKYAGAANDPRRHTTLKAEHVDAPYAVLTIDNVREVTVPRAVKGGKGKVEQEPALVLEFKELPGFAYFANFSGIKKLVHGLGVEEREWFGKPIVLEKRTTKNPENGQPTDVLWVADSRTWDAHFKAAAAPRRRGGRKSARVARVAQGVADNRTVTVGAKRASKKARR